MSTPSNRGQRGASASRGAGRATPFQPSRGGRAGARGAANATTGAPRGNARGGRGRGGAPAQNGAGSGGDGLLQKLRAGTMQRGSERSTFVAGNGRGSSTPSSARGPFAAPVGRSRGRGRGRGAISQTFNEPKPPSASVSRTSSPMPSNQRDFMNVAFERFQVLKQHRDEERVEAIRDGFLADPDKKTSLDNAITPVGTCTDMCPEFERVERIVQNMVDKAEKVHNDDTGKDLPAEDRMVKRFRRSAAGYDEQLPSDIRTPETLKRTLNYLLDKIIGGEERLATVHKYVWDRTRGIRNDFSIQQVTRPEDVRIAVECYERIARFHILSLHQLANPDNLWEGENFDAHQEREQLNNTLLSLLYYYDDNRQRIDFPNEGEFRSYCIIFELQSQNPDLEDRIQSWPEYLLSDKRVTTALKLYKAAGNTLFDQGPLRPMEGFAIAQNNSGAFWSVLSSNAVPYIMACVSEIYFGPVRFAALDALWHSAKSAPAGQQARSRDWSLLDLTSHLGFDTTDETRDFCAAFGLYFTTDNDEEYLDPTSYGDASLDQSSIPRQQSFSHNIVERKRYRRSLTAVINGGSVAEAILEGWVEPDEETQDQEEEAQDDGQSLFVPENRTFGTSSTSSIFGSSLNPAASTFTPASSATSAEKPSSFGQPTDFGRFGIQPPASSAPSSFTSVFGQPTTQPGPPTQTPTPATGQKEQASVSWNAAGTEKPSSTFGWPTGSASPASTQPFSFQSVTAVAAESHQASSPFNVGFQNTATTGGSSVAAPERPPAFTGFGSEDSKSPFTTSASSPKVINTVAAAGPSLFGPAASTIPPPPIQESTAPATSSTPPSSSLKFPKFDFANPSHPPSEPSSQQHQPTSTEQLQQPEPVSRSQPFSFPSFPSQPPPPPQPQPQPQSIESAPLLTQTPPAPASVPITPIPPPAPPSPSQESATANKAAGSSNLSSSGFKFPPVKTTGTAPTPDSQHKPIPRSSFSSLSNTPKAPSPLRTSTTPPHSPNKDSSKPASGQKDKERLLDNFARVALLRPNGLIQHYVEYNLPEIVQSVFIQYHRELHLSAVASIRERIMMRKFANIWRSLTWNNVLRRKANDRRLQFSETLRAQEAKKRKSDEELEAILAAVQETKQIQRALQQQAELEEEVKQMIAARKLEQEAAAAQGVRKVAGRKRKSLSQHDDEPTDMVHPADNAPTTPRHKRSRTIGALSEPAKSTSRVDSHEVSKTTIESTPTSKPLASSMGCPSSNQDLRQSRPAPSQPRFQDRKMDKTKTDYFRLKALGIDPDTPLIPLTDKQLELKRQKEEEERQRMIDMFRRRRYHGGTSRPESAPNSPPAAQSSSKVVPSTLEPKESQSVSKITTTVDDDDDDLLNQAKAQRKELEEGTSWLRDARLQLDQEINQEVERRQESRSVQSSPVTANFSNGLVRANGYEYLPAPSRPGQSLSRTEQRIRATGAHGLAFKPLRTHTDYVPVAVAMSKRSASRYSSELASQQISTPMKKKRPIDEVDPSLDADTTAHTGFMQEQSSPGNDSIEKFSPYPDKRFGSNKKRVLEGSEDDELEVTLFQAPYANGQNHQYQREDYVEPSAEEYSDEDIESQEDYDSQGHEFGEDGNEEDLEEEEEEMEEEELYEEEDDDDHDDGSEGYGNGSYPLPAEELVDDTRTPSTNAQPSRAASSAPGASADDAFVLSDSD